MKVTHHGILWHSGILLAGLLLVARADAATPFITSDAEGNSWATFASPHSGGYNFTVGLTPLEVTALGIYDRSITDGGASLAEIHPIGIFDMSGNLVASVSVLPTGGFVSGEFRYASLSSPIILTPGLSYNLFAYYPSGVSGDVFRDYEPDHAPHAPDATLNGVVVGADSSFNGAFAWQVQRQDWALVGPNFQFDAVPEPPTSSLVILGLTALFFHLRQRRRSHPKGRSVAGRQASPAKASARAGEDGGAKGGGEVESC